jgi:hypothetical protein
VRSENFSSTSTALAGSSGVPDAGVKACPPLLVDGAAPAPNSLLASGAAELHFTANWSLLARFDGEFALAARTYAGIGMLRYAW